MSTNDIANRLTKLNAALSSARKSKSEADGALSELMRQLKQEFGCGTVAAGKATLAKMGVEITGMEAELNESVRKLEQAFDWDSVTG